MSKPIGQFVPFAPYRGVHMRRVVLMVMFAALVTALTPTPGGAGAAGPAGSFTLGGQPCSLIAVPAADGAAPVATGTCPGVRPGGRVVTDIGLCTYNFLFSSPDGQRYIGTAGHCILGAGPTELDAGEQMWAAGAGPVAKDSAGNRVGEFAYAALESETERDFALIRVDPGVETSGEMCHFGGPTGVNDDLSPDPVVVEYFGQGVGVGSTIPARSGAAVGLPDAHHVYANGIALPGDSGSAVNTSDGRALGVLVTTGFHGLGLSDNGVDFGTMGIRRLSPLVSRASEVLGVPLQLVTA